jgi:hypothetical protein
VLEYDGNSKPKRKPWKLALVERFIRANPEASVREVVNATRSSAATVLRARKNLISEGVVLPAATGRPPTDSPAPTGSGPEVAAGQDPASVEAEIAAHIDHFIAAGGKPLTREERRLRLSAYADHPKVPHAQKIAALRELEATEPKAGEQMGPGVPQTQDEAVTRSALTLEYIIGVYGMDAARDALNRALTANNIKLEAFIS